MSIPPKTVRDTARRYTDGGRGNIMSPVRADSTSLAPRENYGIAETPDSLPVLQAFHEFIESERKTARNRLITLSLFFIAVVISVIAAAMFVSVTFFDQVRSDVNIVQAESVNTRQQLATARAATERALTGLDERTALLRQDIIKDDKQRTSLASKLGQMDEVIIMLELENSSLKKNLGAMSEQLPQFSNSLNLAMAEMQRLRKLVDEAGRRDTVSATTGGGGSTIVASIVLPGSETGTAWHFPIPE